MRTEKEKWLAGEEFCGRDPEFLAEFIELRKAGMIVSEKVNGLGMANFEEAFGMLAELLTMEGTNYISLPFHCEFGNVVLKEGANLNSNCFFQDLATVSFGKGTAVGPNCSFYTATHSLDPERRAQGYMSAKPITVGNNVFIGGSVNVQPGVTIGDNSVIGTGSVVTKDIPANVFAAGNPCKVIKEI